MTIGEMQAMGKIGDRKRVSELITQEEADGKADEVRSTPASTTHLRDHELDIHR